MWREISKCCRAMRMNKKDAPKDSTPVTVPPWSHGQDKSTQTTRPVAKEASVVSRWRALGRKLLIRFNVATVTEAALASKAAAQAATAASKSANKPAQESTPKKKKRNRKKGRRMQTLEEEQGDEWESVNV